MNDEGVVEDIVTKFLLNTCRLRPQLSKPAVLTAVRCAEMAHGRPNRRTVLPLTTGSVALHRTNVAAYR